MGLFGSKKNLDKEIVQEEHELYQEVRKERKTLLQQFRHLGRKKFFIFIISATTFFTKQSNAINQHHNIDNQVNNFYGWLKKKEEDYNNKQLSWEEVMGGFENLLLGLEKEVEVDIEKGDYTSAIKRLHTFYGIADKIHNQRMKHKIRKLLHDTEKKQRQQN